MKVRFFPLKMNLLTSVSLIVFFILQVFSMPSLGQNIVNRAGCTLDLPSGYPSDITWTGGCKNGLADGQVNIVTSTKGETWKAYFSNGKANGETTIASPGYYYSCGYKDGVLHGYCVLKTDGTDYMSRYSNGEELEGSGYKPVILGSAYSKKSRTEGTFFNGRLNGFGVLTHDKGFEEESFRSSSNGSSNLISGKLVATGIWKNGFLVTPCDNKQECAAIQSANLKAIQISNASRQSCEAQKKSCFASCPAFRGGGNNDNHFSCTFQCREIACY